MGKVHAIFWGFLNANLQVGYPLNVEKGDYEYTIRISDDSPYPSGYGKVIYIHDTSDAFQHLNNLFLKPLDYLTYGKNVVEVYSKNILEETNSLRTNTSQLRYELIDKTQVDLYWKDRLDNLKSLRNKSLDPKEFQINEARSSLEQIENFYENQKNRLDSLKYYEKSNRFLFENETYEHLGQLSRDISETKWNLNRIEQYMSDIGQIYYGELGVAVDERAIYESWDMTKNAIEKSHDDNIYIFLLMILTIFVSVLVSMGDMVFSKEKIKYQSSAVKFFMLLIVIVGIILIVISRTISPTFLKPLHVQLVVFSFLLPIGYVVLLVSGRLVLKSKKEQIEIIRGVKSISLLLVLLAAVLMIQKIGIIDPLLLFLIMSLVVILLVVLSVSEKKPQGDTLQHTTSSDNSKEETNKLLRELIDKTEGKKSKKEESSTFEKLIGVGIIIAVIKSIIDKSREEPPKPKKNPKD